MFVPYEAVPLNDTVVIDATCLDHLYISNAFCVLVLSLNLYDHGSPESQLWPSVTSACFPQAFPRLRNTLRIFFFLCVQVVALGFLLNTNWALCFV